MTKDEIRTAIRTLLQEEATDAGTLLPSGNTKIDLYIDWAAEQVVLDLVPYMPEVFLKTEDMDLSANASDNTLTAEFLQVWGIYKKVTDESPSMIQFIPADEIENYMTVGETAEDPSGFTLIGDTVRWIPTPSTDKTAYCEAWLVTMEAADVPDAGPAYIPRLAHKLVCIYASMLICQMTDKPKLLGILGKFYEIMLTRVIDVYGYRIQNQPRFLKDSFADKKFLSTLDPAFYDLASRAFF